MGAQKYFIPQGAVYLSYATDCFSMSHFAIGDKALSCFRKFFLL